MLKILHASSFFKLELSYFVEELKKRNKMRKLLNLSEVALAIYSMIGEELIKHLPKTN